MFGVTFRKEFINLEVNHKENGEKGKELKITENDVDADETKKFDFEYLLDVLFGRDKIEIERNSLNTLK